MATEVMKELVVDNVPKRIVELKFGILSKQDIVNQGETEICDRVLFDLERDRQPRNYGPLDARLGVSNKSSSCETCDQPLQLCNGHFGFVRLPLPVFHIGYFKMIITILQEICKDCSNLLLMEDDKRVFLRDLRRPGIDNLRRTQICKKILEQCKKARRCYSCGSIQGVVKKAGSHPLKIIHDRFRAFNTSSAASKVAPPEKTKFDDSFSTARKMNVEVERNFQKAMDDMNPLRVLNLFRRISSSDCELLGMDPAEGRPEMFIWQLIPAPPVCIRPSVAQEGASTEDDLTTKLADIVHISSLIREGLNKGLPVSIIMEQWDFLQIQIAMYINSDVPGLQQQGISKSIRGFCQRLKGKQGRFRGNLSGKRVDFSGRTVISPDPNLAINEVAVPELVAKNMTYPETVNRYNIVKLRARVLNGPKKWPGANYVHKKEQNIKQFLKYGKSSMHAENLREGDIVERHLEDGDVVLFNRQPSLHKLSILSHYVKVRPHRTFRLNECVCNPYNADFDGDEMNLHVPQTEEARAEARELMGVKYNLCTPKNGEPIISAIQDFITAAYLLSSKEKFYDRKSFTNICMYMFNAEMQLDLPPPTILKPTMLWTGKQVFNVMMRPNKETRVFINLDAACREYRAVAGQPRDLDKNDGWLCVRNSEIMCGVMDKSTIGSGKKDSIFYVTLRDYGPDAAIASMSRLAKLCARWLATQGFSIGINDVYPGGNLLHLKKALVERAYTECDSLIVDFKEGKLAKASGCDEEQTLENSISGILNKVRGQAGDYCISELSRWNSPLIMATSGSKGSNINVSQMVAVVGQQIIGGKRVGDGFQDRSLPHFPKNARQPPSKGFVRNSFFSGLNPSEFLFHACSGREGLVDTAVKTAETGYMSRRLMKSLEDLSSHYDNTVRNSSSNIIQFQFGEDKLDPVDMEGKAKPVNFERSFKHAEAITWNNSERSLVPWEIHDLCNELLAPERRRLARISPSGKTLEYRDHSPAAIDEHDSARDFLDDVEGFINDLAERQTIARKKLGLPLASSRSSMEPGKNLGSNLHLKSSVAAIDRTTRLSRSALEEFVRTCLVKYKKAQVEPGHAVGAVGAQSIGEPGTQMTLKTFHFAGVAGMSITQGVPRIKEIINASKVISTPVVTCELLTSHDVVAARVVKGRIEKTFLKDIVYRIEDCHTLYEYYIALYVDFDTIHKLQLDISTTDIVDAIARNKKLKIKRGDMMAYGHLVRIRVDQSIGKTRASRRSTAMKISKESDIITGYVNGKSKKVNSKPKSVKSVRKDSSGKASKPIRASKHPKSSKESKPEKIKLKTIKTRRRLIKWPIYGDLKGSSTSAETHLRIQTLKSALPEVVIKGYPDASRAVIKTDDKNRNTLLVEGYGLRACMTTEGVDGKRTKTNSVMEMRDVLGIEAARKTIIDEIDVVMGDMDIDPRHMQLLADVMTYKGEVLGITRFGLSKMRDSVLQLASFEKTPDHLFEAAWHMKSDKIEGVSECIIMGQSMSVGTGAFQVVRKLNLREGDVKRRETVFEDCFHALRPVRTRRR